MNVIELKKKWLDEESAAHIHGWDFSHISERYAESTDLPWDYQSIIKNNLTDEMKILDIDTGGGEFLLSLNHPFCNTSATEGFHPNVKLCKQELLPLGIDFREMHNYDVMPFDDNSFDMVINRHGKYNISELYRVLKSNGLFITQQVGNKNDRELIELLLPNAEKTLSHMNLAEQSKLFSNKGFKIIQGDEAFSQIRFFDTGALVWFARIIEWEFPNFSVDNCFDNLLKAEEILRTDGCIKGTTHRYIIVARK